MNHRPDRPLLLYGVLLLVACIAVGIAFADGRMAKLRTFDADDRRIEYVGRVDFTDPKLPRFWSPGVYVSASFTGPSCGVLLNDQVLWGTSHNYIEYVVDGVAKRQQLTGATNMIQVAIGLGSGKHTLVICKDTESGIGYLEFAGLICQGLTKPDRLPSRKIEFIGDSITAGAGSDTSDSPCGVPVWYSQHNAYMSYGPKTARLLNAQWMISAVSGIGLVHSCCGMNFTMPDVYDKIANRPASDAFAAGAPWNPASYQPDVITICLGQNDGEGNIDQFVTADESFIEYLRKVHPDSQIVLLTSPMGNARLTAAFKKGLAVVADHENDIGDKRVSTYFFSRSWNDGCGGHPTIDNDTDVAAELAANLKTVMHW